jgi:predicted AAA+ superfamily ATPase
VIKISPEDVDKRLSFDNPWWDDSEAQDRIYGDLPKRSYFLPFLALVKNREVRRAIILMGPRRVGKTVILHQTINQLLKEGTEGKTILFLSMETPIYTDTPLETFVRRFQERFGHPADRQLTIFFDEIQYLRDWEVHLKSLVDSFPHIRFVVSGSAAAALRLKSRESGAGRFTEFLLPPLTFAEYLDFIKREEELVLIPSEGMAKAKDIDALNREFINYLNYGGYPEAVINKTVRDESNRFIKNDIIDKVLMRDLPQLYGIRDIQELNRLFTTLAYNTGNEITLEALSQSSGVSKTTLSRYLEYLEAAFLIRRVHRIDQNARHFQRATSFKVYLTNPSMRAALFGYLAEDDQTMGSLAETALFAQWFHDSDVIDQIYYARWGNGEIDMVFLDQATQKPLWATEVKWSDRPAKDPKQLRHLEAFMEKHPGLEFCEVTTRTYQSHKKLTSGLPAAFTPTSLLVYEVGKFVLHKKMQRPIPTP